MTKLTNCSIIACPKQRRRPPGRKYVARPTDHPTAHQTLADQPTVPPGIPPSAHLNSPNQLSPTPAGINPNSPARAASDPRETSRGSRRPGARNAGCEPQGPASGKRGRGGSSRPRLRRDEAGNGDGGARRLRRDGSRPRQASSVGVAVWRGRCER